MTTAKTKTRPAAAPKTAPVQDIAPQAKTGLGDEAFRSYEGALFSARDSIDAVMTSGSILSRGLQDISRAMLGLAQEGVEDGVAASRRLAAARTLRDLVDLQSAALRDGIDRIVTESIRLSDLSVRVMEEAVQPIHAYAYASLDKAVERAR